MDSIQLTRILNDLQGNVPKFYRDTERTAYLAGLLDMAHRIINEIEREAEK